MIEFICAVFSLAPLLTGCMFLLIAWRAHDKESLDISIVMFCMAGLMCACSACAWACMYASRWMAKREETPIDLKV
jgi:hypothetical protein